MSTEDNKTLMRRFIEEAFNKKNLAAIEELIAPITLIILLLLPVYQSVPRDPGKPSA
jgi:hypothetical protein